MKLGPIIQPDSVEDKEQATLKRKNSAEELPKPTTEKRPRLENETTSSLSYQPNLSDPSRSLYAEPYVPNLKDQAVCFNCGQPGHILKDCHLPKAYESKVCFACHEKGHTSKFCPRMPFPSANAPPYQSYQPYQPAQAYHAPTAGYPAQPYYPNYSQQPYAPYSLGPVPQQYSPVPDKRCFTCNMRGHAARDCPEAPLGQKICFSCGARGHVSKECQSERAATKCYTCGQLGHVGKECPEGALKVCYFCKATDHLSASCPQRGAPSHLTCYSCGLPGHKSSECPSHPRAYATPQGYSDPSRPPFPSNQNRYY